MRCTARSSTWLMLLAAASALGGCGGDDDTGDGSTVPVVEVADPPIPIETIATQELLPSESECGLSDDQVSSVMGIEMVPIAGTCGWEAPGLEGAVVEVYVSGSDSTMLEGAEGDEVAGVGDEARFNVIDVLNFRLDDRYYYVQVLNMGGATEISSHDASVALANLWIETLG